MKDLDKKSREYPIPQNGRDLIAKYGDGIFEFAVDGYRCRLAMKLIEMGVLSPLVLDFSIHVPLHGAVTITATFGADQRINEAIAEMEAEKADASRKTTETDSYSHP